MTGINYTGFESNRPFRLCAEYVDRHAGDNNGEINGDKEQALFKKIIKARYGYDYDFNKDLQTQADELANKKDEMAREGEYFFDSRNSLYSDGDSYTGSDLSIIGDNCGKSAGSQFATDAIGYTTTGEDSDFSRMNRTLDRLLEDYTPDLNNKLTVNFLKGYYDSASEFSFNQPRTWLNWSNSGLFEQLGHENDSSKITNGKAAALMKKIMDAVPEDKRNSEDYKTLESAYQEYSSKNSEEKFGDKSGMFARMFGTGYLDNLDDAVERLFDL